MPGDLIDGPVERLGRVDADDSPVVATLGRDPAIMPA